MFEKNKKKQHSGLNEIDIHDAIKIKSRLNELSQLTDDQNDKDALLKASQLISTLIAIYGMWGKSQKTIKNLLRKLFGKLSEKINTPKSNENCNELKGKIENDNQTQIQTKPNDQNDDSKKIILKIVLRKIKSEEINEKVAMARILLMNIPIALK